MSGIRAQSGAGSQSVASARIGPNAIVQLNIAAELRLGDAAAAALFEAAGLAEYRRTPPQAMVDESEVIRLHAALRSGNDPATARDIARTAGRLTGDYILKHRIPAPVRIVLKTLPAGMAAKLLVKAIGKHSWTFCGSGAFAAEPGPPLVLTVENCPICRDTEATAPVCDYYAATFARLFEVLVSSRTQVGEIACQALGAPACRFEIIW